MRDSLAKRLSKTGLFAFSLGALIGCGHDRQSADSHPLVKAAAQIGASFEVVPTSKTGHPAVAIRKDALDKEFLLQAALIDQTVAAMGKSLRSRVVAFQQRGAELFLMEATSGHTVTTDLPQKLILAAFPIVAESADSIEFDFNKGMSQVFLASTWSGHDATGRDYQPAFTFAKVGVSYLEDVKFLGNERLQIRQIAQVPMQTMQGDVALPVEMRYVLSPYRPSADFEMGDESDFKTVGFFEVAPRLRLDGTTEIHSTKFPSKKPIVFSISSNTPAEYRQALRDGVLYWKAVRPNIEVQDAPEGATAPDADLNLIQWVPHDRAGLAYADAQMDPRTGEVLRAQTFITSTFAFGSKTRIRRLLRSLEQTPKPSALASLSLQGFQQESLCQWEMREDLRETLAELVATQASDGAILRVAQDYVRSVVAHEVGHVLGLRHNFAGSLAMKNYDLSRRKQIFRDYLDNDSVPTDVEPASTQMDYSPTEESALIGHMVRTRPGYVLPYDRLAISMLYDGYKPTESEKLPFCTDSDLRTYVDCRQHDAGASWVEFAAVSATRAQETLPTVLLENFVAAKAPLPWETPKPVQSVNIDPKKVVEMLNGSLEALAESFNKEHHTLHVASQFPYLGDLNEEAVREREVEWMQSEITRLGGWEKAFPTLQPKDYAGFPKELDRLARSADYREGIGLGGQKYRLEEIEIESMVRTATALSERLPNLFAASDLKLLKRFPSEWKNPSTTLGSTLAPFFAKRAAMYLTATHPTKTISVEIDIPTEKPASIPVEAPKILGITVGALLGSSSTVKSTEKVQRELPLFLYDSTQRDSAASLLRPGVEVETIAFAEAERKQLKKDLLAFLDKTCGCDFSKLSSKTIRSRSHSDQGKLVRWVKENRSLLGQFDQPSISF